MFVLRTRNSFGDLICKPSYIKSAWHFQMPRVIGTKDRLIGLGGKLKCLENKIKFLGHNLGRSVVRPNKEKIRAIVYMPRPENVKDLPRFVGIVNYLCSSIEDPYLRNTHFKELLRNDVFWHWSEYHEE